MFIILTKMPIELDRCVRKVRKKIREGKIKKTYIRRGKRVKTNPWAICKAALARKRKRKKKK